jgi:hypothetical protein
VTAAQGVRWRVATESEVLPRPKAATGVVFADVAARVLTVRLSELEDNYSQQLWKEGWAGLRRAQEAGWPINGTPPIWADVPGGRRVVAARPVDGGALSFHFPPGTAGYSELVSKPRLTAIVTMDVSSRRILAVRFLNGPA